MDIDLEVSWICWLVKLELRRQSFVDFSGGSRKKNWTMVLDHLRRFTGKPTELLTEGIDVNLECSEDMQCWLMKVSWPECPLIVNRKWIGGSAIDFIDRVVGWLLIDLGRDDDWVSIGSQLTEEVDWNVQLVDVCEFLVRKPGSF